MIVMGGWMKGKALIFGVMGLVFIVLAFTMSSFMRTTFLIIGIADLAAAGFSYWMAKSADASDPGQPGQTWVG
jgi:hypothetical protein